jgi:uncharacterized protein (TIGR03083 family)
MQLTPRYDGTTFLTIEGAPDDQREPLIRQRRRLQHALDGLRDDQWATPSRCDGWTVQDVISHLVTVNQFWSLSIGLGVAGTPTQFLATFDPVATPAQLVEAARDTAPAETLEQFAASNEALFDAIASLDEAGWNALAEAPPGHITVRLLAHHALWDGWVHERDVLLPLGVAPDEEPDEVISCLRYAAALGPTFALAPAGSTRDNAPQPARRGSLVVDAIDPDVHLVVDVADIVTVHTGAAPDDAVLLTGRAVDLVEALSIRAPLGQPVPEASRWLLGGLAEVFDTTVALD